jgi:predicted DNA-binding transcriptional regulator AlpA
MDATWKGDAMTDTTEIQPDLLYGVPAIARFLGIKQRSAYHLIETGRIPHFKIGKTVAARRSKITAALERLEDDHEAA